MQKQSVYVIDQIRKKILDGELEPGYPISERVLSSSLGTSRVPVREAFIHLEDKGLIRLISGRGAFVRVFSFNEIRELYEVRGSLEGQAASSAAKWAPKEEFRECRKQFVDCLARKETITSQELQSLNSQFHDLVGRLCNNNLLSTLLSNIHDQVVLVRAQTYKRFSTDVHVGGMTEHVAILDAIIDGDGPSAERLMRQHIGAWFERQISYVN
ncbi:MAG: GntR family transcriptional regulator [Methylobacteriaceae bacterium]|jgi:DNA-binding GntR family transcriptional regulator|nr:GntR family transcriptional regulator [Methylobacteriaceae bacterium]